MVVSAAAWQLERGTAEVQYNRSSATRSGVTLNRYLQCDDDGSEAFSIQSIEISLFEMMY